MANKQASVKIETARRLQIPHPRADCSVTLKNTKDNKKRAKEYLEYYRNDNSKASRVFNKLCRESDVRFGDTKIHGSYFYPEGYAFMNYVRYALSVIVSALAMRD